MRIGTLVFLINNESLWFLIAIISAIISTLTSLHFYNKLQKQKIKSDDEISEIKLLSSNKFNELKKLYKKLDEQLRFTLAGAKAGSLFFNCSTQNISFDNRSFEILGSKKNILNNKIETFFNLMAEPDNKRLENLFFDALKNKIFWESNFKIQTDSHTKHISIQCYIQRNNHKEPVSVYGLITDITEKKIKEEKLVEDETKYRLIFEKSKMGLIILDMNGRVISANNTTLQLLEVKNDDISGKTLNELSFELIRENGKKILQDQWPTNITLTTGEQIKDRIVGLVSKSRISWLRVETIPISKPGDLWPYMVYVHFEDITQQKKMINELQRSENKYRNLADNALIGIFRSTIDGEISYINKSLSDILEYDNQVNAIGKNPMFLFANNKDRRFIYQALKDNTKVENLQTVFKTAKGNKVNVIINAQWMNESISGMVMDVTEIIKTRDELNKSKENLQRIFSSMQEGYIQFNLRGKILSMNPSALRILKYPTNYDLTGKNIKKVVLADSQNLEEIIEILKYKGKITSFPLVFKNHNNKTINADCNMHFVYSSDKKIVAIEGTFRDFTYQKLVDDALKSLLELNRIMESYSLDEMVNHGLEEAVQLTNSHTGFFHFVNDNTGEITMQSWSKANLNNALAYNPNQEMDISDGIWIECIKNRKPIIQNNYIEQASIINNKTGSFSNIRELVIPVFESNKMVAVLGVGNKLDEYNEFDIDQLSVLGENIWSIIRRKKAEDEIIIAKEIAESANKAKSIFLANITHEIRTPLNAVIGFSELMFKQIKDPIQKNYLESIKSSGRNLLHIINDILDLSKIDAGHMNVSLKPASSEGILEDVHNLFTLKAQQKNLDLIFKIPGNNRYLYNIDELRLRQILINLIENALKFTNEGFVKVSMKTSNLNKKDNTCTLIFVVEDSGIGISDESLNSIFESFRQQEEQDIKKYGGTGLGLAISKKLAELMNGNITVSSVINRGSKFTLTLSDVSFVKRVIKILEEEDNSNDNVHFEYSKLLVVDDVKINRDLIRGIVKGSEIEIIEAENGEIAVELAKKHKPDLILMDIRMPIMDGYEATRLIKQNEDLSHIPIVALTASISAERKPDNKSRFDGFLKKPVTINYIRNELKKHLPFNKTVSTKHVKIENKINTDHKLSKISPELVKTLNKEISHKWEEVRNTDNMDDIIEFANIICETGKKYNIKYIEDYGNEIIKFSQSFDLENINILLNSFPKIKSSVQKISI